MLTCYYPCQIYEITYNEEFEGPEKLGLAPKVLQNLWGSAEPFSNINLIVLSDSWKQPPKFQHSDENFLSQQRTYGRPWPFS